MAEHYTTEDVRTWVQSGDRRIFLGDVLDKSNSDSLGVGFARYAPGEANPWTVTYDEALVVTAGTFTVTPAAGEPVTAGPGEVIYLRKGTELTYSAGQTGAELVYATYPVWADLSGPLLDQFHPLDQPPAWNPIRDGGSAAANVALIRRIWDPIERGETTDLQPFWDSLADDVVMTTSVGELHGKEAVRKYFSTVGESVEFNPFLKPLQYYADGDRVVITGTEVFTVKETRETHEADWTWLLDLRDGLTTRITAVQDLSGVAGHIAAAVEAATSAPT